jgi:WD40 repeat protein
MKKQLILRLCLLLIAVGLSSLPLRAQQQCQPPAALANPSEPNIFNEEQESDLGDVIAEQFQRDYRVIEDDEVSGHLREIGARIVKHLPPTKLRIQFFLVDMPEANAFVLPGGRVYVSRKLIAFVKSEDELAGVLAHEIGHLVSHEGAIDMTRMMKEVLGVTQVTDRRDIFEKYNQLLENVARKPGAFRNGENREEKGQQTADLIGLYALSAAGYNPQAQVEMWDRLTANKGKKGNFFTDLFGTTSPTSRRFREMAKGVEGLPATCKDARQPTSAEEFQRWQAAVVNYTGLGRRESLHNVISKQQLEPPLRGDITHLRFSPDGHYVIAQDDAGINVLTREPFAPLFRIEAPEAYPAQFTPDSQDIVLYNSDLRVQTWNVAEQKLKSAQEVVLTNKQCLQTALAPNGKTLACLDTNFDLYLFEVATGAQIFQKKSFYVPDIYDLLFTYLLIRLNEDAEDRSISWVSMNFSPDGRYFAAGSSGLGVTVHFRDLLVSQPESAALAFDLTARAPISLSSSLKKLLAGGFTFIGADRIVGMNTEDYNKSAVVTFPAGDIVKQLPLGRVKLAAPTHGNYLLIRPIASYPVGVMNLADGIIFKANKQAALDLYDDVFVSERVNGELGLYGVEKNDLRAKVLLPRNPLGRLRAASISPDFKWLAVSERTRGAVWDVTKGERLFHLRGFRGVYYADDGAFYVDFPKQEPLERTVGILQPQERQATTGPQFEDSKENKTSVKQAGPFVTVLRPAKKEGGLDKNTTLDVKDVRNMNLLWSRNFQKETPDIWVDALDETMTLSWAVKDEAAKAEIKSDPALTARLSAMKEKEGDYFLQSLDARTGKPRGRLLIETGKGSFRIAQVINVGEWVVIVDSTNRVLIYSLTTGEQKGKVFGNKATVAKATGLLCVENETGQLSLYDLATMQRRDQFIFSSPVSLARFSADGQRLFVLTANQNAYVLDVSKLSAKAQS